MFLTHHIPKLLNFPILLPKFYLFSFTYSLYFVFCTSWHLDIQSAKKFNRIKKYNNKFMKLPSFSQIFIFAVSLESNNNNLCHFSSFMPFSQLTPMPNNEKCFKVSIFLEIFMLLIIFSASHLLGVCWKAMKWNSTQKIAYWV